MEAKVERLLNGGMNGHHYPHVTGEEIETQMR